MSILRSSKFVKYFVSFARSIAKTQPVGVDRSLLLQSRSLAVAGTRSFAQAASSNIDRSIQRLDQDVRRTGRISSKELLEVFDEIRQTRHATSTQSLMVIRCCGNVVPEESPEVRTRLVNQIWETFEKIGVDFDISHYNALLRVYLENEHEFSPTEFLAKLEAKGIEPNRVTFQRLVAAYCQKGDIEGATQILEFMKEKQIPVNESVFNSLITGHSQADDMESAVGILRVMDQAAIPPSADTYTALMCGFAKKGDIASIEKYIEEGVEKQVEFSPQDLLDVALALAVHGHTDKIEMVISHVRNLPGYNQEAKNAILRLMARGEDDAAMVILRTMTPAQDSSGNPYPSGVFFVKQMVKTHKPVEKIVALCKEMKESNANPMALLTATETSLLSGTPEMSLKLLSALAEEEPVCQHYYWPVLVQYGKSKNVQGILATLRQMIQETDQSISGETLRDYVIPYLSDGEKGIQLLRQGGIPLATAASALVSHLLFLGHFKEAANIALRYRARYSSGPTRRAIVSGFLATKDLPSLISLVRTAEDGDRGDDSDPAGLILLDLASALKKELRAKYLPLILEGYLENGIGISNEVAEAFQNKIDESDLTEEISSLLSKLTSSDLTPTELVRPTIKRGAEMNEATLLSTLKSLENRGESTSNVKRQLFTYYCYQKDLDKALDLKKELENEGFEFQTGLSSLLMDLYVQHDLLDKALDVYHSIKVKDPATVLNDFKIVNLASLFCRNDRVQDAIQLLEDNPQPTKDIANRPYSHNSACWRLLNSLADRGDPEILKTVFKILVDNHYIVPNNVLLGPLVKVHLIKNDTEGALAQFEECCTRYRATPWKNEIARKLIEKEDAVGLQRLTDLSTQIHGEVNSLYDLVLSFIECGRIRQARRILETPGLRTRTQRLRTACERYTNEGKVSHIENLVEATKDLTHIDRSEIYYHLLTSYAKSDDVDKAMGLWTQMQDEDVQPSDKFLFTLGHLLKKHGRQVPFKIPETVEMETTTEVPDSGPKDQPAVSPNVKALRRAIHGKEVDEAISLKNKLNPESLTIGDRSRMLTLLMNSGRLGEAAKVMTDWLELGLRTNVKTIGALINSLAKAGDLDHMQSIEKYLNKDMKKMVSYSNRWTHCMVEAGKGQEVIQTLINNLNEAKTAEDLQRVTEEFPRGGLFSIMNSHSDMLPLVEELAEKYRARGILDPTNSLWIHYTMIGDTSKADEAWSHLKPSERLMFQPIVKLARKNADLEQATALLEKCRAARVSSASIAVIYSAVVDILLSQGNLEESMNKLNECLKVCALDDVSRNVLVRLKSAAELRGIAFPHQIPALKKRQTQEDTSSSSSSDSDTEETAKK